MKSKMFYLSCSPPILLPSPISPSFVPAYFCHWCGGFRKDCFFKSSVIAKRPEMSLEQAQQSVKTLKFCGSLFTVLLCPDLALLLLSCEHLLECYIFRDMYFNMTQATLHIIYLSGVETDLCEGSEPRKSFLVHMSPHLYLTNFF